MSLTALNGTQEVNDITYNVKMVSGVYLYVKYTKGDESNVTITFTVNDEKHPNTETDWFNVSERGANNTVQSYTVVLTASTSCIIPVSTPESAYYLKASFAWNGGTSGDVEVWANNTNKYN